MLKLPNGRHVAVHPVSGFPTSVLSASQDEPHVRTCYPFVPGYSLTICKCQGQTLQSAIVWFDCDRLPEGSGYVALSRVKTLQDIKFLTPQQISHFKAVSLGKDTS